MKPPPAYRGDRPYLFVSYAHEDREPVFAEIHRLNALGYRLWYDGGIDPSTIWLDEISRAILNCAGVLLFLSPDAARSDFIRKELVFACEQRRRVIAVHLADTGLDNSLGLLLSDFHFIQRHRIPDDQYLEDLRRAIQTFGADMVDPPAASLALQLVERGLGHLATGALGQAEQDFDAAIRLDPFSAAAYYNRGRCRFRARRLEESLDDFSRAHEIDPTLEVPMRIRERIQLLRLVGSAEAFCRGVAQWPAAIWSRLRGSDR